ncbi:MAG: 2,3-epoxybenzoyl-CoA dihydrolase [Pseudomonadota bacterium]|nr:2,3-epoxybenzoyl-CoA dihydrolase [Pseudomonadota bacterium]
MIDFERHPDTYRHWRLELDGDVAWLRMDVDERGGLRDDYELKLNSYDLGVDIELHDCVQRLRFEHPEVRAVILTSANERVFCAGANIRMLAGSAHPHKVNFCKFTNETRLYIEDATANSGQTWICAVTGSCAGGGYELALACDWIMLADDGNSAVSLPEVPLLAVLPGTGGLTRLVDKRRVRRDRADVFCTTEEGMRGKRAVDWRLVDEVVPRTRLAEAARARAADFAARSTRPSGEAGVELVPLGRVIEGDTIRYGLVEIEIDRANRAASFTIRGPESAAPADVAAAKAEGAGFWPLRLARELDDAMLHLRLNEEEIGSWVFRTEGDADAVQSHDAFLDAHAGDWFITEVRLFLKRVLKRLDLSARSLFALIEPGSCFTGTLLELALAADRSYMLDGRFEGDNRPPATVRLTPANFGPYPMSNGLTRLQTRFLGDDAIIARLRESTGADLEAVEADELGLVTYAPDDIDWEDEVRLAIEERAAFSPDAMTGMEASLRFPGPETMETRIFARLSAWQNWIFQRPNATGPSGALPLYGTGQRGTFDRRRA